MIDFLSNISATSAKCNLRTRLRLLLGHIKFSFLQGHRTKGPVFPLHSRSEFSRRHKRGSRGKIAPLQGSHLIGTVDIHRRRKRRRQALDDKVTPSPWLTGAQQLTRRDAGL
uniref:Uncharacterized protein MANES_10G130100 n=1 Tax=Rhizophora mucronata TaxID=61149 RepID=A0A2P2K423_RHIMU